MERTPAPSPLRPSSASPWALALALATLGACAGGAPVPATRYALGQSRADYRDYSRPGQSICDAEPRWLSEELGGVNTLLARFLEATQDAATQDAATQDAATPVEAAQAPEGSEQGSAAERTALLEEASRTLAPVVQVHRQNLQALQSCSFRRAGLFPALTQRGQQLVARSEERLAKAPSLLAAAALQQVREQWALQAPQREASARQTWCPARPVVGTPDLFFARRALDGRTEWLFCDGHRVEQLPGAEPTLHAPEGLGRQAQRRVQPARYLQSARSFPESEMDLPPTGLPAQPGTAPAAGTATP